MIFDKEISRFKYPQHYSNQLSKAIQEFKDDVSTLYINGLSYDEALTHIAAKYANGHLVKKFTDDSDITKFPYYKRFVDYVYTRDEVKNPFGHWLKFRFWEPLYILEFAQSIAEKNKKDSKNRIQVIELSSIIFYLFRFTNFTSSFDIKKKRKKLLERINKEEASSGQYRLFKAMVASGGLFENKPIRFIKPSHLYEIVGVSDYRTFEKHLTILGCLNVPDKYIYRENTLTITWVFGVEKLYERFQQFYESHHELMYVKINDDRLSGIILDNDLVGKVNHIYNHLLIRDKNNKYIFHLEDNPLIRIKKTQHDTKCYINENFYDFRFIIGSLYVKRNNGRNTLKSPIKNYINEKSCELILSTANNFSINNIREIIDSKTTSLVTHPISTPKNLNDNRHYNQIEESRSVIKEMQANGIMIDVGIATKELESLTKEWNKLRAFADEEFFEDEDNSIPESEQNQSIKTKINDLKKILETDFFDNSKDTRVKRIYGIIRPHGANTQRLSSSNINIQGISKDIREKIFRAPDGYVLLSADVSGQDIAIAANLADKLYSTPEMFNNKYFDAFKEYSIKIKSTIDKLAADNTTSAKPIDHILKKIIDKDDFELGGLTERRIREIVKEAVYSFFYGGGKTSFVESNANKRLIKNALDDLKDACKQLERSLISEFINNSERQKKLYRSLAGKNGFELTEAIQKFLTDFRDTYLNRADIPYYTKFYIKELKDINGQLHPISLMQKSNKQRGVIYDRMREVVEEEYPGILESFLFYNEYYSENNLIYPTFLGFQTPVVLEYQMDKIVTRSKSYPVQASRIYEAVVTRNSKESTAST